MCTCVITTDNLVEAHCYGIGRTGQLLSNYEGLHQLQHCNWRRPLRSKRLTFQSVSTATCCSAIAQVYHNWHWCDETFVWECGKNACVYHVYPLETPNCQLVCVYALVYEHIESLQAFYYVCVTIALGQTLLTVVAKLTQPGLSMWQQCSPQKSADFQSLASMYWCGICPHHMTIAIPFKEGTMPGLQPQGGLCTLQEQSRGNTGWYVIMSIVACNGTCHRHCIDSWIARLIMSPDWCGNPFCIPITSADRNVMFILPIAPCYCSERVLRLSPLISSMFSAMCCGKGNATCVSGMSQELMCDSTVYIC